MVWVVGSKGMLGCELCSILGDRGIPFLGTDREWDFTDPGALRKASAGADVSWVVNCAAYTAVDRAEDEECIAHQLNCVGPRHLADFCRERGARLVHVSTDYVFEGTSSRPYTEEDTPNPASAYGRTKHDGEKAIQEQCPANFIFRTSWLYGGHGTSFVHTMIRLMRERSSVGVVSDQRGSPTWTRDLAEAITDTIQASSTAFGTYHYSNEGEATWFEFAQEIRRLATQKGLVDRHVEIQPLRTDQYPTRARRPAYSVLSKVKVREVLGCRTPDWKSSLEKFISIFAAQGLH